MSDFVTLLQQGNAWLYIPSAILLGALHGLEPGHSKTMMAAFIVAVRGTVWQAVLLGLAATLSHTAVVWLIAMAGLYFGQGWNAQTSEPYLQLISAILIIGVAGWMIWRTWHDAHHHHHDHDHHHPHDHANTTVQEIDTGHGRIQLAIDEAQGAAFFEISAPQGALAWRAQQVRLITQRENGLTEEYSFAAAGQRLRSQTAIPEPHSFVVQLELGDAHHRHTLTTQFDEAAPAAGLALTQSEYQDAHERAHAEDIRRRFSNRDVTTGQIVLFGLTGGLIPCPASITVLLLCLQVKKVALGATLVLSFSIGLALTMVASGTLAALGVRHASQRWAGFSRFTRQAPYFSGALIILVGLYLGWHGASTILASH